MGTYHQEGWSLYTPAIEVKGTESVVVEVAVCPPLTAQGCIEVQDSVNEVDWVSHPMPYGMGWAGTVRLPEDPARSFVRVRLCAGEPDSPPRSIQWRVRWRRRRPRKGRDGGVS